MAPALASAATITVDSTADEADLSPGGGCATAAGKCTLRAAIEVANLNSEWDKVNFDASVFDGEIAGTIKPANELPAIVSPMTIVDFCPPNQYNEIPQRPCVGVDAGGGATGFRVESDEVAIEGISVTGATVGIDVVDSSDDFVARQDWIGMDLGRNPGPNSTGILLGPGSNDAKIGGYINGSAGDDLIVNNSAVGLDLEGASRNRAVGNAFGLVGDTAAPNGKDIEITDRSIGDSVVKAVENEIGGELFRWGELTNNCDEACNVISGAVSTGIDLEGDGGNELPATGPTMIRSNFIGANSSGEAAVPNGYAGIVVGDADQVTIGGPREKDGNLITGGLWGVLAGSESRDLVIENNDVGRAAEDHQAIDPPTDGAFSIDSSGIFYSEAIPGSLRIRSCCIKESQSAIMGTVRLSSTTRSTAVTWVFASSATTVGGSAKSMGTNSNTQVLTAFWSRTPRTAFSGTPFLGRGKLASGLTQLRCLPQLKSRSEETKRKKKTRSTTAVAQQLRSPAVKPPSSSRLGTSAAITLAPSSISVPMAPATNQEDRTGASRRHRSPSQM